MSRLRGGSGPSVGIGVRAAFLKLEKKRQDFFSTDFHVKNRFFLSLQNFVPDIFGKSKKNIFFRFLYMIFWVPKN